MTLTTADDVASQLHVSLQRIYELDRQGVFPPGVLVKIGQRQYRFDQTALEAWVANGGFAGAVRNEELETERPARGLL